MLTVPDLPAGNYVITAKAGIGPPSGTICRIVADSDIDEGAVAAGSGGSIPLILVHTFSSTGKVEMRCSDFGGTATVGNIKIVAIQVDTLVNSEV